MLHGYLFPGSLGGSASVGAPSSSAVRGVSEKADAASRRAREVEDRIERLALATEAMWEIVRQKVGATDDELKQLINDLDLSDGKLDGKMRRVAAPCPKCRRINAPRMRTCLFCGNVIEKKPFA